MPGLLDLLKLTLPATPPVSPEQQAEMDRQALATQATLPGWKQMIGSGMDKGMGFLRGVTGLGDQGPAGPTATNAGQVLGAMLPMTSVLRNPAIRATRFEALLKQAETVSPEMRAAVEAEIQTHPRVMAHFQEITPSPLRKQMETAGGMTPKVAPSGNEPRAMLELNPRITGAMDPRQTVAHEAGHMADMIKIADRARQRGLPDAPDDLFKELYARAGGGQQGYSANQFETRARTAQEASTMPRTPGRFQQAQDIARDPVQSEIHAARALNRFDELKKLLDYQDYMRENNAVLPQYPTSSFTDLLATLDPRFQPRR